MDGWRRRELNSEPKVAFSDFSLLNRVGGTIALWLVGYFGIQPCKNEVSPQR